MKRSLLAPLALLAAALFVSCATAPSPEKPAAAPGKVRKERTVVVKVPVLVKESSFYADGLLDQYVAYKYDDAKARLLEKSTWDGSRPEPIERVVPEWRGKLLAAESTYDAEGRLRSRREMDYDAGGRMVAERVLDGKGQVQSSSTYSYDAAGNKVEWKVLDAKGLLKAVTAYAWQGGRLVLVDLRDPAGKSTGSIKPEYDASGALLRRSYLGADGSPQKAEILVYGAAGTPAAGLLVSVEYRRADGSLDRKTSYELGSLGETLAATTTDGSGAVKDSRKFEYAVREDSRTEVYFE